MNFYEKYEKQNLLSRAIKISTVLNTPGLEDLINNYKFCIYSKSKDELVYEHEIKDTIKKLISTIKDTSTQIIDYVDDLYVCPIFGNHEEGWEFDELIDDLIIKNAEFEIGNDVDDAYYVDSCCNYIEYDTGSKDGCDGNCDTCYADYCDERIEDDYVDERNETINDNFIEEDTERCHVSEWCEFCPETDYCLEYENSLIGCDSDCKNCNISDAHDEDEIEIDEDDEECGKVGPECEFCSDKHWCLDYVTEQQFKKEEESYLDEIAKQEQSFTKLEALEFILSKATPWSSWAALHNTITSMQEIAGEQNDVLFEKEYIYKLAESMERKFGMVK